MVSYAGRLLAGILNGEKPAVLAVEFKNALIVRESTGPCPAPAAGSAAETRA
jgi:DNA-binding LacI/PurR family transcriptional regulator